MGCASSKQKVCRNCQAPCSPVRRSYSMSVHHPPSKTGDSYHLVSLTSSTLGSLKLDPSIQHHLVEDKDKGEAPLNQNQTVVENKASLGNGEIVGAKSAKEEFEMGMIEAKTWSKMINEKIPKVLPKTPIRTPPGEPETINAWEMMEGLEDISPLRPVNHFRSFSFHVPSHSSLSSVVSEFDPEVIATFRRALEDLPPTNPFHLKPVDSEKEQLALAGKDSALELTDGKDVNSGMDKIAPRGTDKLIVYFTSLRGVRKTYEDCCHVRVILKGLGVKVDERDVSMHSGFKEELKELLSEGFGGGSLPRVFLGKKCIGGADEIRRLNEEGKL
ncbi:UNVERIFIED_CONTAM: hypothetical protein Slati_1613300 [Sesamum latifolium]|uniref:Glutaredoxin domain-containing protein n=1 Tax=Sesamum latifolium TaxID=2727402 RepID=A0AAW2XBJ3_9LAMI